MAANNANDANKEEETMMFDPFLFCFVRVVRGVRGHLMFF
jgi:hypothetical protein